MRKLAIIGAGELGKQILNLTIDQPNLNVVGFFDDTIPVDSDIIYGYKVIGTINDVITLYNYGSFDCIIIGIGYRHIEMRMKLFNKFSKLIPMQTLIHKSCIIDSSAIIGNGCVLYPGCIIDKNVIIEDNVLLNLNVVVAHDSIIRSHCFVAPSVTFSGFVNVDECNFIGTGTTIRDNLSICSFNRFGVGSVVVSNIVKQSTYFGNPAKSYKKEENDPL